LAQADFAGHSYGGWIAARQAIHAPDTVDRLVLLPNAVVEVLPEATHHTVPAQDADAVNGAIRRFLA